MLWQRGNQPLSFILPQEPDAPHGFFQHADLGRAIQPLPVFHTLAQNRAQHFKRSVYRGVTYPLRKLGFGNRVHQATIDGSQGFASKMRIQSTQLGDIFRGGGFVRLLLQPPHDRFAPKELRLVAKLRDAPQFRFHTIMKFLR